MGSLMAGWGSHVHDIQYERNKSLTKGEIASFWRLKKMEEEELFFLEASHGLSKDDKSEPLSPSLVKEEDSVEPLLKKHGWWISSKWAFLNEPPNMSWKAPSNYVAQFHIATKHIDTFDLQPASNGLTA